MASSAALPDASPQLNGASLLPKAELHALFNWLIVWVVLANAAFVLMWAVGAPPRSPEIVAFGAIGLLLRDKPFAVQLTGFLAVMAYSVISFIAGLFNLTITSLVSSLRFFLEIDPLQSKEYIFAIGFIVVLVGVAAWRMHRPQAFKSTMALLIAAGAVLSLAGLDMLIGQGMRGHYARAASADSPFESAVSQSGFADKVPADRRHLMLVMVESLGSPVENPEMSRLLFQRYNSSTITESYEVSRGTTTYYNSTTAGEVRELCGRWGDYFELLDRADPSCLPARLRDAGYETYAAHTFVGDFFERETWYPNLGFGEQVFAEGLVENGAERCGGVFSGACDRDIPEILAARLKMAQQPQFIYWLTLNSHLPVPLGSNLGVGDCAAVSATLAEEYPMICRQFAIWDAIDAALVAEITDPDFPPTDILIVGDHMPPYFDRPNRRQFAPDNVPWLFLRWRGDEASAPTSTDGAS